MQPLLKENTKLIIVFVGLLWLVSCGSDYTTRVDVLNGFEIDYPSDWDTAKIDPRMTFEAIEGFSDSTDVFGERFNISVFPHGGNELSDIVDQNVRMANQVYGSLKIERGNGTNENGVDYIQLKMPYPAESLSLINQATFIVDETSLYTITQICEEKKIGEYQEQFDTVINSFKWIEED